MGKKTGQVDPQLVPILRKITEHMKDLPAPGSRPVSEVRSNFLEGQRYWNENGPYVSRVEDDYIPGPNGPVKIRHYRAEDGVIAQPFLIFFHGGGWVAGSTETHDYLARHLVLNSGIDVISVDYGLAPELHFPETVKECLCIVTRLHETAAERGLNPEHIALGGDSAGANLSLSTALSLRDAGENWVKLCVLLYAALNPERTSESHRLFGSIEYGSSPERFDWFWNCYVPDLELRKHPLAAPLRADFANMPPMFLAAAGLDPLKDDTVALYHILQAAGISVEYKLYPGMIHGFLQFIRSVDAAKGAADDIAAALKKTLSKGKAAGT